MSTDSFFEESKEQSAVKTAIVSKYFWSWAKVIIPQVRNRPDPKIAYLDLFAGPGRYKDGTKSTPLLILETAIEDPDMSQMLVTIFNDKDDDSTRELEHAIDRLPGIEKLKHHPLVMNDEVGSEMVKVFSQIKLSPDAFFRRSVGLQGAVAPTRELGAQRLGLRLHFLLQLQPHQYGPEQSRGPGTHGFPVWRKA